MYVVLVMDAAIDAFLLVVALSVLLFCPIGIGWEVAFSLFFKAISLLLLWRVEVRCRTVYYQGFVKKLVR